MKFNTQLKALAVATAIGLSGHAMAAGTVANTPITNTVTLGYSVNSTDQTAVESTANFRVDQKVDMTLTSDTASADTAPGETIVLAYTLTNTGNLDQDFVLSLSDNGDTNHTPQAVTFYPTATDAADETNAIAFSKISASEDGTPVQVFARVTISNNVNLEDGDILEMRLTATALDPSDTDGTTLLTQDIADDKNADLDSVYVIFAEDASVNDAKYTGAITVQTDRDIATADFVNPADANAVPELTIEIVNDVVCDSGITATSTADYSEGGADVGTCPDLTGTTQTNYRPKAIPTSQARLTYSALNDGSVTANEVVFTETLPAEYQNASLKNPTLSINGGANETLTLVASVGDVDADNEYFIDDTTDTITLYVGDIAAGDEFEITFTAIVE